MNTIFAPLCDHLGLASRKEVTETRYGPLRRRPLGPRRRASTQGAAREDPGRPRPRRPGSRPGRAPRTVTGRDALGGGTRQQAAAVCELGPERYWSAEVSAQRDGGTHRDIELLSVAITIARCQTGLRPLVELRGELDHGDAHKRWRLASRAGLIQRANAAHRERRRNGGPIMIRDVAELKATKLARSQRWIDEDGEPLGMTSLRSATPSEYRPPGRWRIRPCTILRVS